MSSSQPESVMVTTVSARRFSQVYMFNIRIKTYRTGTDSRIIFIERERHLEYNKSKNSGVAVTMNVGTVSP